MYMNVSAPNHGPKGTARARVKSVVDTRSTHNIISLDCLSSLGLSPHKHGSPALVALDGKALTVRGFALLRLDHSRSDGCVHLSVFDLEAVVVDSLDAVGASFLEEMLFQVQEECTWSIKMLCCVLLVWTHARSLLVFLLQYARTSIHLLL